MIYKTTIRLILQETLLTPEFQTLAVLPPPLSENGIIMVTRAGSTYRGTYREIMAKFSLQLRLKICSIYRCLRASEGIPDEPSQGYSMSFQKRYLRRKTNFRQEMALIMESWNLQNTILH
jgi:hypothetical protein